MSETLDLKRRRLYQAGQILVQEVLAELNALDVHGAHHSFRRQEDMEEVCIALALYGHKHRERDGIIYLLGSYIEGEQPSAPMLSAASVQKLQTISMHFGMSMDTVLAMAIDHYYRHRVSFEGEEVKVQEKPPSVHYMKLDSQGRPYGIGHSTKGGEDAGTDATT